MSKRKAISSCCTSNQSGSDVADAFLRKGVIVRPIAGYGYPDAVRVTIGTQQENERFIEALKVIKKTELVVLDLEFCNVTDWRILREKKRREMTDQEFQQVVFKRLDTIENSLRASRKTSDKKTKYFIHHCPAETG